jgi:predicted phage tail component-like protein
MGFTLDSVHTDTLGLIVTDTARPPAPQNRAIVETPGRDGAWFGSVRRGVRSFGITGVLYSDSLEGASDLLDALYAWLPVGRTAALVFDDMPDRTFFVMLDGDIGVDEQILKRTVTFTLMADDPYGYGAAQSSSLSLGTTAVSNDGSADAWPVFTVPMTSDALGVGISVGDDRVLVGTDPDVNVTPVAPETRILNDDCSNTSGWTTGTNANGGTVAGAMGTVGGKFYPTSIGSGATWHGPVLRKTLSSSVADFVASVDVVLSNLTAAAVGQLELYVLNASHVAIAKVGIMDGSAKSTNAALYGWLGSYATPVATLGRNADARGSHLNGFVGTLSIERRGSEWHMRLAGHNSAGFYVGYDWHVNTSAVTANVADVEVRIAGYGTYSLVPMSFDRVQVTRYNAVSGTPLALLSGQVLTIDTGLRKIYVDGHVAMDKLSPLSKWPRLPVGASDVVVTSDGTIGAATCVVSPRWQ